MFFEKVLALFMSWVFALLNTIGFGLYNPPNVKVSQGSCIDYRFALIYDSPELDYDSLDPNTCVIKSGRVKVGEVIEIYLVDEQGVGQTLEFLPQALADDEFYIVTYEPEDYPTEYVRFFFLKYYTGLSFQENLEKNLVVLKLYLFVETYEKYQKS